MKLPRSLLVSMLLAAGLACGIAAKKISSSSSHPNSVTVVTPKEGGRDSSPPVEPAPTKEIRSEDTAEILLAQPASELYGRLALWLLDVDESEISAFLQSYRQQGGSDYEIPRLLFANWTRLNPQGAIDAAASDGDRNKVWSAWASHDPEAALAADAAAGGSMSYAICSAIGEFHPAWMLAHFDRIPDTARAQKAAISALRRGNPPYRVTVRTLKLAEKWQNPELTSALLTLLADSDPFQGWLLANAKNNPNNQYSYDSLEMFMYHVKASQYGELERIADTLPPGELKRQLDYKAMELLTRVDPEAALAKARASEVPRIKAQLLSIAGKAFIYSDPKKALQIADELFAACPGIYDPPKIELPDGTRELGHSDDMVQVYRFISGVSLRDPVSLMESFLTRDPELLNNKTLTVLSKVWARQAPESYAEWLNNQTDPRIREPAARVLVGRLSDQAQYPEALDWAVSLADSKDNPTDNVFRKWRKFDPTAALEWLDAASIPDERKVQLREEGKP